MTTASETLKQLLRGEHDFGINVSEVELAHNPGDTQAAITLANGEGERFRVTVQRVG